MSPSALTVLAAPGRLFAWKVPLYSEDLAFYSADRRPWLGSIAHEQDAFLYSDHIDVPAILTAVPGLALTAGSPS
jgi:hypothetical protein